MRHDLRYVAAGELRRGYVDGEPYRGRPLGCLDARCLQDPPPEIIDQADCFGDRNELLRGNYAAFGVTPAEQGLNAGETLGAKVDGHLKKMGLAWR